MADIQSHIVG